jgi:outer membrane protein
MGLQTDYVTRNQVAFSPARQWTVGLNLQVPLYDGGLSETRVLQAREIVEQLQALYDQARRNASLELQSLALELSNRYQRLAVTERNLASAAEAARIARLRYQNGLSTNVEMLDAEAAFTTAQQEKVSARYQYLQALARYRRAAAV